MKFSPEVQDILDRVKAGEPILSAEQKRERARAQRAATPKPVRQPRPAAPRGPYDSRKPSFDARVQRQILDAYAAGQSINAMAQAFGLHSGTVRNCLKWHDVWTSGGHTPVRRDLCPVTLLALWEQGNSAHWIAKHLGADRTTVARNLRDLGITVETRRRGRPGTTVCPKGHDKGRTGQCPTCRREYLRDYYQKKVKREASDA